MFDNKLFIFKKGLNNIYNFSEEVLNVKNSQPNIFSVTIET